MGRGGKLEWVAVDPAFGKEMNKRARRVMPKTMAALEKHAKILREDVERNWPVKTGRSKAAFKIEVQATSKGPRFLVLNTAKNGGKYYALFVRYGSLIQTEVGGKARRTQRRKKGGKFGKALAGKFPIQELLFKPAMKARKKILEDIAGELTK